jgi:hypothetical protein
MFVYYRSENTHYKSLIHLFAFQTAPQGAGDSPNSWDGSSSVGHFSFQLVGLADQFTGLLIEVMLLIEDIREKQGANQDKSLMVLNMAGAAAEPKNSAGLQITDAK